MEQAAQPRSYPVLPDDLRTPLSVNKTPEKKGSQNMSQNNQTSTPKSQVNPTPLNEDESKDRTIGSEGAEAIRCVGSLYPDATLWGVPYITISSTGAPPPDFSRSAKKDTRKKSSFRRAAMATARFLGLSRDRPSHKLNQRAKK